MAKVRLPFNGQAPVSFAFGAAPEWYLKLFGYPHNGVDFAMGVGRAILACDRANGFWSDEIPDSDGKGIILYHDWGLSLYWHLSHVSARKGAPIKKGDVIGHSGATGIVTGPHLHWGMKVNGEGPAEMRGWVNPLDYLESSVQEPEPEPIEPRYYTVRPGDNLWKIAEKFYREGVYWRKIYEVNKDKIRDPGLIFPLQRFLIP